MSFDQKLGNDVVTRELQDLVKINEESLSLLHKKVDTGRLPESELAQAQENLARAKIELARRREELTKTAGGGRLEDLNDELSQMAIDATEQKARLDILRRQLDETQAQLAQASAWAPQVARLQAGQQALNIANQRIAALASRMVRLQPPTVTVIGADSL
jgi:chromosome segregation ATPase